MPEINRRWIYPTITASENKGIERIALSGEGTAHEVVGVDGSRRFGCRPSSGFRLAHTFDIYKDFSGSGARPFSSVAPPTQSKQSIVTDSFPVHFQIREGEFAHGFIYRVKNVLDENSALYMDYVPTNTVDGATGWRTVLISDHSSGAGSHVSSVDKMDVVSMGRYIFTFVKGRATRVFYIEYNDNLKATATFTFGDTEWDDAANATITLIDGNGTSETYKIVASGADATADPPEFNAGANASEAATNFKTIVEGDHGHKGTISIVVNASPGKVDMTQEVVGVGGNTTIAHSTSPNWDSICDVNPPSAFSGGTPTYTHKIVNGGPGKRPAVKGGAKESPAFTIATDGTAGRDNAYSAEKALQGALLDTDTAEPDVPADTDLNLFKPGDYTFAYYLHDSLTGRRTALTDIISKSETGSSIAANGRYIGFILEIDTDLYDEVYMFRSVKMQSTGGTYMGSILHLDTIYNIADEAIDTEAKVSTASNSAANYPSNIAVYKLYYQLDDIALTMQDIYLDKTECDDEMPFCGAAVAFNNSLIVADPQNGSTSIRTSIDSRERNIGELRWSSLTERSPELFPINNKYAPELFQNRITRLCRAGDYAIGFSADRLYHIRRNGIYLKIEEMHTGFGLASENGFAMAGPLVYFVTTKGLKAVANNGQLDDVQSLDNLLLDDWYSDLSSIRLSYDPYISCLFIHNPVKEQTVCMWFSTGRVTEFHDTCFDDTRVGIWPKTFSRNPYDDTSPTPASSTSMVERSFFLQNHPSTDAANISADWKPRAYVLDIDRSKVQANSTDISVGSPVLRTLDAKGDSVFTVAGITDNATNRTINLKSGTTGTKKLGGGGTGAKDLVGAYAYILSASDSTIEGSKFQIYYGTTGTVSTDGAGGGNGQIVVNEGQPNPVPSTLAAGDVIAISPVLVRYVGGALPMVRTQDNKIVSSFDLFQNKQISSIGCHFTDVSGGVAGYKFYEGLVFNSESDSAAVRAFPRDFSGTIIGDSIKNGESEDYSAFTATGLTTTGKHGIQDSALNPGIEIFCPDLDYKLMALICRGRTTGTDTTERNT